jgi:hypothetical protein
VRLRHALSLPSTLPLSAGSWLGSWLGSGPTSRGRQVAVLRLHAASTGHVTKAAYSCLRGVYVRHVTKCARTPRNGRISENPECELRRIYIPRTRVNKGRKKGRSYTARPFLLSLCGTWARSDQAQAFRDSSPSTPQNSGRLWGQGRSRRTAP